MFVIFSILTALMVLVIVYDLTSFIIPNWLNGLVIALYPLLILTSPAPVDWQSGLMAFGIVLVIGFVIFAMKWMGGGDIKLFAATALWLGLSELLVEYLVWVAIVGGVLSVILYFGRKALLFVYHPKPGQSLPRILREGEPVPYGLAIAGIFTYYLWMGKIPALGHMV